MLSLIASQLSTSRHPIREACHDRKFSWLHTELVPYMYSGVVECHNGAPPLMRLQEQGKYHYLFGNDLLVAPIYADKLDWTVTLPPGRWRYLFHDDELTSGPAQVRRDF